jgi:predicted RNA-binding protein YlxR (DUF448 family)
MVRFAQVYNRSADNLTVTADNYYQLKSRGLWIKADKDVLKYAHKKNSFNGALKRNYPLPSFELFMKEIEDNLKMTIQMSFGKAMDKIYEETASCDAPIHSHSLMLQSSLMEMIKLGLLPPEQVIKTIAPLCDLAKLQPSPAMVDIIANLHRFHLLSL